MKKKKVLKGILLTLLAIIAVLAVSAYCLFNFYIKPKYSEQIAGTVNELMNDDEFMAEVSRFTEDEQLLDGVQNAADDNNPSTGGDGVAAQGSGASAQKDSAQSSTASNGASEGKTDNASDKKTSSGGTKKSLVERAREEATPAEFAAGARIAGKLDVGYLTGLMQGGLTAEEKKAAKAHITSRLTSAEISKMFELYNKYSYLLK